MRHGIGGVVAKDGAEYRKYGGPYGKMGFD